MGKRLVDKNEFDERVQKDRLGFRLNLAHCPFIQVIPEKTPADAGIQTAPTPLRLIKTESASTKTCTVCGKTKPLKSFYKNRSKPLGVESACRTCVGKQKRKARQTAKKKRLSTVSFTSVVVGELGEETIQRFAESYSEIVRDLHYDKKI
jgi:hypothetical protein